MANLWIPSLSFEWFEDLVFTTIDELLHPGEVQRCMAWVICGCILFNCIVAVWAWNKYGKMISERFMIPATTRSLEEFKKEATLLKLPLQHSPRI